MSAESPDLAAAKRLLDAAKRGGFHFQRVAPGPDGPLWSVRETLQWRDTVYLAGFGEVCTATRSRKSSLIVPGGPHDNRLPGLVLAAVDTPSLYLFKGEV